MGKLYTKATVFAILSTLAISSSYADEMANSINIFGVIEVHSKSTNTIVSVPWLQLGYATNESIRVCDLVLTNNLTCGDTIIAYGVDTRTANQACDGWVLTPGGWESMIVIDKESLTPSPSANVAKMTRGKSFWLMRQHPSEGAAEVPFYICGQYTTEPASGVTIEAGTEDAPVFHLLAPPYATDTALNSLGWDGAKIGENDTITVPINSSGAVRLHRFDAAEGKWYYTVTEKTGRVRTNVKKYDAVIPAGTGFWYISRGGAMEVVW